MWITKFFFSTVTEQCGHLITFLFFDDCEPVVVDKGTGAGVVVNKGTGAGVILEGFEASASGTGAGVVAVRGTRAGGVLEGCETKEGRGTSKGEHM